MPRKHLFMIVVLLVAALAAGTLALTRTASIGSSASASSPDASIAFRLKKLDRFEAALQSKLARQGATTSANEQVTVYRHATALSAGSGSPLDREDGPGSDASESEGQDD